MNGMHFNSLITAIALIILFAWSVGLIKFGNGHGNMQIYLPVINIP